ncbi:hypothetical protein ACA910_001634 [Epithemia clementina (nom. ined.)]
MTALQQEQQHQPHVQQSRPPFRSFWTRSSIYNRHEARRAKTLANANDNRPAVIRVLAQIPGAKSIMSPARSSSSSIAHAFSSTPQPSQLFNSSVSSSTNVDHHSQDTDSNSAETVFTMYKLASPSSTKAVEARSVGPLSVALSAAAGAKFADWVLCLDASTSGRGSHELATSMLLKNAKGSSPAATTTTTPMVRYDGSALSILLPKLPRGNAEQAGETMLLRSRPPFLHQNALMVSPKSSLLSPSMLPFFVLFGSQALVERRLLALEYGGNTSTASPNAISIASLTASGVAGATVGLLQRGRRAMIGTEVIASIVYFGSYRLLKTAIHGNSGDKNDNSNKGEDSVIAIGIAGAMAGTLSELVRGLGATSSSSASRFLLMAGADATVSPFAQRIIVHQSLKSLVIRAAPAHALLFLGYEAALGMMSPSPGVC